MPGPEKPMHDPKQQGNAKDDKSRDPERRTHPGRTIIVGNQPDAPSQQKEDPDGNEDRAAGFQGLRLAPIKLGAARIVAMVAMSVP